MPDASAIISCYKSKEFIQHKIQNILESTADIEIVIVECAGGHDIKGIPKDSRITTRVYDQRISIWKAMNIGISIANSDFVVQANTDDLVHPEAYQKQIDKLNAGNDIAYFDYYLSTGYHQNWENALKNTYTHYMTPQDGYSTGCGLGMFPMWRKSLHNEVGPFDENLEIYGDSLFWDRLVKAGKKFGRIPEKLGVYAQRDGQNLESNHSLAAKDSKYLSKLRSSPKT